MEESLTGRIATDIKAAMRSGDKRRLGVLRLVSAAIKQHQVDQRTELDEAGALALVTRMVKQRNESIEQYRAAGRDDLAAQEEYELGVLREYLPEPLSDAELEACIDAAIQETGATGMRDMGRAMGVLKPRIEGRADPGDASARLKRRLQG